MVVACNCFIQSFTSGEVKKGDKSVATICPVAEGKGLMKMEVEKGWQWTKHVGPAIGKKLCPKTHVGVLMQGSIKVTMEDGTEKVGNPGDVYFIGPNHDGEVVGDETVVGYELVDTEGMADSKTLNIGSFADPSTRTTQETFEVAAVQLAENVNVAKLTVKPGWQWSKHIKPLLPDAPEWCPKAHHGFLTQGTLRVKMSDGTEKDIKAGDAYVIEPGHDGWVVGDEEVIGYEFDAKTAKDYSSLHFGLDEECTCFIKSWNNPDHVKKMKMDLTDVTVCPVAEDKGLLKMEVQPGWEWSKCIKPVAKTEWCEKTHVGMCMKGECEVIMKNGEKKTFKAGDTYFIPAGHDGKVISDHAVEGIELTNTDDIAKALGDNAKLTIGSFDNPTTEMKKDNFEFRQTVLAKLGDESLVGIAKMTVQPGWKWSEHIKPMMPPGTEWCPKSHFGMITKGEMHVLMKDGKEYTAKAGDVYTIPPGHDGWVVGDETLEGYEFDAKTAKEYIEIMKNAENKA